MNRYRIWIVGFSELHRRYTLAKPKKTIPSSLGRMYKDTLPIYSQSRVETEVRNGEEKKDKQ